MRGREASGTSDGNWEKKGRRESRGELGHAEEEAAGDLTKTDTLCWRRTRRGRGRGGKRGRKYALGGQEVGNNMASRRERLEGRPVGGEKRETGSSRGESEKGRAQLQKKKIDSH